HPRASPHLRRSTSVEGHQPRRRGTLTVSEMRSSIWKRSRRPGHGDVLRVRSSLAEIKLGLAEVRCRAIRERWSSGRDVVVSTYRPVGRQPWHVVTYLNCRQFNSATAP